ncbi:MAG: hypothetical protein CMJ16_01865 [Peredibacter sp.]|nr:hypothetical protein [Peredibacter sp.]
MEVKPHSQKNEASANKGTERLPSIPLNLCHVISEQNVAKVTVEGLKLLTYGRIDTFYNGIKSYTQDDVPSVVQLLRSMDRNEQSTLVEAMAWILHLNNSKNIERLIVEGESPNEGEVNGTYLCRVFVNNFKAFRRVAQRSFGDFLFEKRTFTIFRPVKPIKNLDTFQFTQEIIDLVKSECKVHFRSRNYSEYCDPIPGNYGQKNHGLEVNRGSREDGAAKIKNEKTIFNPDRYKKSDIMFIDRDTGLLWISVQNTNQADLNFYKNLFSKIITGEEKSFEIMNFDFSFLYEETLSLIGGRKIGKIEKILLREARYRPEVGISHKGPFTTGKGKEDCLTKYDDFMENRLNFSQFTSVKLHVFLEGELKDEIIIKQHSVSTRNQIREEDMMALLSELRIMPMGHYDA